MKNHLQVLENIHQQFRTLAYSVDSWYSNVQMKKATSDLIGRFFNICKVEGLGIYDIHSGVESCKVTVRDEMKALNIVNDADKINFIAKLLQKQRNDLLMRYEELDDQPILNAEALQNLQINLDRLEEIRTEQGSLDLEQSNLMYRIKDLLMEDLTIMLGLRTILETLSPDSTRIFLDNVTIISNRLERKIKALADTGSPYTLISREAAEALDLRSLPDDALTTSQAIQGIGEKTQHIKGRTVDIVFANGRAVTITVYIFPRLRNVFGVDLLVGMDTLNAVSKSVHNQNIIDYNHPAKVIAAINESLFQPVEYDLYNTNTNPLSIGVSKEKLKAAKELEDLVRIKRAEASGDFTDEQYKYPHDPEPKRQDIRDKVPINYLEGLLEETQDLSDESDDTIGISKDILDEIASTFDPPIGIKLTEREVNTLRDESKLIFPIIKKEFQSQKVRKLIDLKSPALVFDKISKRVFWNSIRLTSENDIQVAIGQLTALFEYSAGSLYGTETDDFILVMYSNQPVTDADLNFAVQIKDSEVRQHLENRPFKRSSLTKITINFHRYWHSELDESEPTQSSDILGELYKQLKYQKFSNAFYVGYWMTRRLLAANYFKKAEREPEYHLDSAPRTKERIFHTLADYGGRISLQKLKEKHSSLDELKIIKRLIKKGDLQLFQGYDEKYIELPATDFLGFLERYIGQSFDNFVIGAVKNIYNDTKIESLKEYLVIGAISDYSPPELNFYEPKGKPAILRNARFLKFIKKLYRDFSDAHLRALSNLTLPVFIMSKTKELRYWNGLRLSSDYIAENIAIMQGHFKALNTYGDGSFFSFKGKEFEGFAFAPDEISCVSIIKYAVSQAGLEDNDDGYMEISCVNRTKYICRTLTDDQKYFHRKAHLNACLTLYENLCSSINQKEGDS